ncbi:glycoside hydrolase domain-containing protein, partial [Streptomyces sp. NPDC004290]
LYGGRAKLGDKLDEYFSTPETAGPQFVGSYGGVIHEMTEARDVRMGNYGHSNQVAHHVIYMYDAAGQPWKTQKNAREVLSRLYTGSEIGQGYHGDEDNGEQSAWYVFSALGFYPLVMGGGEYAVGSPLFTKATVHLENGKDLVIKAPRNSTRNIYVQGLKVNGKAWTSTSLPHTLLAKGGVLEFDMGPRPSSWPLAPGRQPWGGICTDLVGEGRAAGGAASPRGRKAEADGLARHLLHTPGGGDSAYLWRRDAVASQNHVNTSVAGTGEQTLYMLTICVPGVDFGIREKQDRDAA